MRAQLGETFADAVIVAAMLKRGKPQGRAGYDLDGEHGERLQGGGKMCVGWQAAAAKGGGGAAEAVPEGTRKAGGVGIANGTRDPRHAVGRADQWHRRTFQTDAADVLGHRLAGQHPTATVPVKTAHRRDLGPCVQRQIARRVAMDVVDDAQQAPFQGVRHGNLFRRPVIAQPGWACLAEVARG